MSDHNVSGSISGAQLVAARLSLVLTGVDRKLLAEVFAIDAIWQRKRKPFNDPRYEDCRFPALPAGSSPLRFLIQSATVQGLSSQETAARAQRLIAEFVSLNNEAIGFGGDLKFIPRDVSASRLPLSALLELETIFRSEEHKVTAVEIMGAILNVGRSSVDEEERRPGEAFSTFLASLCPLKPDGSVLDMSCGTGTLLDRILAGRQGVHAFGQDEDHELAVISWLRMRLHPSARSAHVKAGDPFRYDYAANAQKRPIDVALVHSTDFLGAEEIVAAVAQNVAEKEKAESLAARKLAELREKLAFANYELAHAHEELGRVNEAAAAGLTRELSARIGMQEAVCAEKMRLHGALNAELSQASKALEEAVSARKAALASRASLDRASRYSDHTPELVSHALSTVHEKGAVVAVVSAAYLFKSPQVDMMRALGLARGYLDMVVEFPRGLDGSQERVAVIVFRRGRRPDPVLFVDASDHEAVLASRHLANFASGSFANESTEGLQRFWHHPVVLRKTRSNLFTPEYFGIVASICAERRAVAGVAALVPLSVLSAKSADGRWPDLRPRQFLAAASSDGSSGDLSRRLADGHGLVAEAEERLGQARQALGLPSLSMKDRNPQSSRRPGNR